MPVPSLQAAGPSAFGLRFTGDGSRLAAYGVQLTDNGSGLSAGGLSLVLELVLELLGFRYCKQQTDAESPRPPICNLESTIYNAAVDGRADAARALGVSGAGGRHEFCFGARGSRFRQWLKVSAASAAI